MEKFRIISYDKQHERKTPISKTEYNAAAACNKNSVVLSVVSSAVLIIVNFVVLLYAPDRLERQQFISFYTTFVICPIFNRTLLHCWFVVSFLVSRTKIMYCGTRKYKPWDRYRYFLHLCSFGSYFFTFSFTEEAVNIWLNGDVCLCTEQAHAYKSFVPLSYSV
jgi:hypothetical protein